MERRLVIGLNVVLAAVLDGEPMVLCVKRPGGWGLPFGRFDPDEHRTFELALRDFAERQTAVPLGYVEQLYTFGDRGREAPRASLQSGDEADRIVSVGYLALSPEAIPPQLDSASWRPWYTFFPWEDQRDTCQSDIGVVIKRLQDWAHHDKALCDRISVAFGQSVLGWEEERALDRYELMYEARIVAEAHRDRDGVTGPVLHGEAMISDHRRILATAIGRLRGKLRYRPVVFELMQEAFTLRELQVTVEGVLGFDVHKQNFRRGVETAGLVEKTPSMVRGTAGRPAALYKATQQTDVQTAIGLPLPRIKRS
ncbi:MAG: NAD regulator [Pseudomonadota bacterium]